MNSKIIKDPVYQQVNRILRDLLKSGQYPEKSKFLTEREIGQKFDVSRVTANKALSNLVSEGLLTFKKGVGTFVKTRELSSDLQNLISFTEKARSLGKNPTTKVLKFESLGMKDIEKSIIDRLGISSSESIFYIERIRYIDELPVIFDRRFVIASLCPALTAEKSSGSLYRFWQDEEKLSLSGSDTNITAIILSGDIAEKLNAKYPSAGLLIQATGFISGGKPLWYEETTYRGDAYEFHAKIGTIKSEG
jgi:GntR family transcriptional regulator